MKATLEALARSLGLSEKVRVPPYKIPSAKRFRRSKISSPDLERAMPTLHDAISDMKNAINQGYYSLIVGDVIHAAGGKFDVVSIYRGENILYYRGRGVLSSDEKIFPKQTRPDAPDLWRSRNLAGLKEIKEGRQRVTVDPHSRQEFDATMRNVHIAISQLVQRHFR
jgi:hypothetical protein